MLNHLPFPIEVFYLRLLISLERPNKEKPRVIIQEMMKKEILPRET
jgi:hypothetical protein